MKKKDEASFKITESQLFAMMIGAIVGVGIITLPRELAEVAGRDGWVSIILTVILSIVYLYICVSYAKLFPNLSLGESMQIVLGTYLGIFLTILYAIYTFSVAAVIMRLYIESNFVYFNLYYSVTLPMLLVTLIIVYIGRCGLATLGRVNEVVFIFSFVFIVLFFFPDKEPNYLNLRPVLQGGFIPVIKSVPTTVLAFLGLESVLVFYPFIERRERVFPVTVMALILTGFVYTGVFLGSIIFLGLEPTKIFIWPFMEYLKLISFQVIDRIDNMFVYVWSAKVFMVIAIQYFAGTFSLAILTKRRYHDLWVIVCWPILFLIGYLPNDFVTVIEIAELITTYGGTFVLLLPIVLLIVAKIRRLNYAEN